MKFRYLHLSLACIFLVKPSAALGVPAARKAALVRTDSEAYIPTSDRCNPVAIVHCYMEELNSWAWNLWHIKENIAALNATSCMIYENLKKCVEVDGCNELDAIELSKVVTDLLHHTKQAGTFLRSYYSVSFACSEKGQEILSKNEECLHRWHLGDVIMTKVKDLWKRCGFFIVRDPALPLPDEDRKIACEWLHDSIEDVLIDVKADCGNEESGTFVCKSIVGPFRHLVRNAFHDCAICEGDAEETIVAPHSLVRKRMESTSSPVKSWSALLYFSLFLAVIR